MGRKAAKERKLSAAKCEGVIAGERIGPIRWGVWDKRSGRVAVSSAPPILTYMAETPLLDAIATPFIESAKSDGFNGVVGSALLRIQRNPQKLRTELSALVRDGRVAAVFSRLSVNIHIKRFPDISIEEQLKLLAVEPLGAFCLYPAASAVKTRVDLAAWQDRPFSKALLLTEPQLSFRAFDMAALERYVADPRYIVQFYDYMGSMSVADDYFRDIAHPERDKVSLQTFGLGFDERRYPYLVVFLRYLSALTAEHQQYWNSYLASGDIRISEPYFRSSFEGEFWTNRSVRHAIVEEMRLIRVLTEAIWGRPPVSRRARGRSPNRPHLLPPPDGRELQQIR